MPLDHISHKFRAIFKNKIFNVKANIETIKLFNPPFSCDLSTKHV